MIPLAPFKLERYFAEYEFKVQYLLSASDCESLSLAELLELADTDGRRRWETLRLGYTDSQGDPALRDEIQRQYAGIAAADVVVAVPEEAIFIAMHSLLVRGQHVIALWPAYQSLYELARSIGCDVSPWNIEPAPDGSGWQLDLDRLEALIRPNTRLLVINFPHNPTGYLPTRETLDAIVRLAERHKLIVFSDEMYRGLELDPSQRLPAMCEIYESGVSLGGLSKAYALPGLRLGWLASRAQGLMAAWLALKDYTTICHSAPSEVLGLMALRAGDRLVARSLALVRRNLSAAQAYFKQRPAQFRWLAPQAGSIAFPAWIGPGSVEALTQSALEQEGLMVVPGSIFEFPGGHFRLGLGRQNFPEALARFERVVARL